SKILSSLSACSGLIPFLLPGKKNSFKPLCLNDLIVFHIVTPKVTLANNLIYSERLASQARVYERPVHADVGQF
ncbi:MAG: hypothetical protein WBG61_13925, partial [Desulfobacterales bacterium]